MRTAPIRMPTSAIPGSPATAVARRNRHTRLLADGAPALLAAALIAAAQPRAPAAPVPDFVRPKLSILQPGRNQLVGNPSCVVVGVASDNAGLAAVSWRINHSAWLLAQTSDGWRRWSITVPLDPGTNLFQAYARDLSGNCSFTNALVIIRGYPLFLAVSSPGMGSISPYTNGSVLEAGKWYTATASPAPGCSFKSWTGGVSPTSSTLTNKPGLRFQMQPGLALQANFEDVQKPSVRILRPRSAERCTNTTPWINASGAASDNLQVTQVHCRLNQASWTAATLLTHGSNWTIHLLPTAGTNTLSVYAEDAAGLKSQTNRVSFFYVVPSHLTLITNGSGAISGNFSGDTLEVGRSYQVTAYPGPDFLFSNWVGTVTADKAALTFLMRPNMTLQANFVPNPFLARVGDYYGLFHESERVQVGRAGFFTLRLNRFGSFSSSLRLGARGFGWVGQFTLDGRASTTLAVSDTNTIALDLNLDLWPGENLIQGTVQDSTPWQAYLIAYLGCTGTNAAPFAGRYNLCIPGVPHSSAVPAGDGYACVNISLAGTPMVSGRLADDSPLTPQTAKFSAWGKWPVYQVWYQGRGMLFGWFSCTDDPDNDCQAYLYWIKPAMPAAARYPAGFTLRTSAWGSRYYPPAPGQRILSLTNALCVLSDGGLPQNLTNAFTLTSQNTIATSADLSLGFFTSTGEFFGSAGASGSPSFRSFRGAVFQKRNRACGFIRTTNLVGRIVIDPDLP
jgi:hypothetical protein